MLNKSTVYDLFSSAPVLPKSFAELFENYLRKNNDTRHGRAALLRQMPTFKVLELVGKYTDRILKNPMQPKDQLIKEAFTLSDKDFIDSTDIKRMWGLLLLVELSYTDAEIEKDLIGCVRAYYSETSSKARKKLDKIALRVMAEKGVLIADDVFSELDKQYSYYECLFLFVHFRLSIPACECEPGETKMDLIGLPTVHDESLYESQKNTLSLGLEMLYDFCKQKTEKLEQSKMKKENKSFLTERQSLESSIQQLKFDNATLLSSNKKLRETVKELREDSEWQRTIRELDSQLEKVGAENQQLSQEVRKLRRELVEKDKLLDKLESYREYLELQNDCECDTCDETGLTDELSEFSLDASLAGRRLVVFGGHQKFNNHLASIFQEAGVNYRFVEETSTDKLPVLTEDDVIIVNVMNMSHPYYYGLRNHLKRNLGLQLYTKRYGVSSMLSEISSRNFLVSAQCE